MADTKIEPNPYSPYANADPKYRHLLPSLFGIGPKPGVLALTACERMAVAPGEPLQDATDAIAGGDVANLPAGLCTPCVMVATGRFTADRVQPARCEECGGDSSQGDLCALCRQELHDAWWATRGPERGGEEVSVRG